MYVTVTYFYYLMFYLDELFELFEPLTCTECPLLVMEYLVVTPALSKFSVTALFTSFVVSTSEVMILIGDCCFLPHIGKSSLHLLGPKLNFDSAKSFVTI